MQGRAVILLSTGWGLTLALFVRVRYGWLMETHVSRASGTVASGSPLRLSLFGDERLARLVGEGSERAFAVLYARYHQSLYRYCRSIVRDDSDAQDALQSTLASAFAALRRGQRDAPLRPWLYRIAHNEAVSLLRRRRPTMELSDACEGAAQSVEERAGERERLRLLVTDLGGLPERQRSALVMRELSGLSHEEIALALGTSPGAAKQAIFEARQALADCEQGRTMACEEVLQLVSDGDRRALRSRRVRAHLRDCAGCAAFAAAIPARQSDLYALAPPLAPAAAAGLLAHLLGDGSSHSGGGAALAAGSAGKSVSTALALKATIAAAVLTTATVGVTRALTPTTHQPPPVTSTPAAQSPRTAQARLASDISNARVARQPATTRAVRRWRARHSTDRMLAASLAQLPRTSSSGRTARRGGESTQAHATPTSSVQTTPASHTTIPTRGHSTAQPTPASHATTPTRGRAAVRPGNIKARPVQQASPAAPLSDGAGTTGAAVPAGRSIKPGQGSTGSTGGTGTDAPSASAVAGANAPTEGNATPAANSTPAAVTTQPPPQPRGPTR